MDGRGGYPPSGNINNNVGGGAGLRGIDPQYAAALDLEEIRLRQHIEAQQDIELRRRLVEEQQNQLISELEYRNKIQQLRELQELQAQQQAQQQQQQQQQQGLTQLLAAHPHLLGELAHRPPQQPQTLFQGRDAAILNSLRDDILLQRQQAQLTLQEQVQQQLQERLARDAQRHLEQEELMAVLRASGNLQGVLPAEAASSLIARLPSQDRSVDGKPPAVLTPQQQLQQFVNGSSGQGAVLQSTFTGDEGSPSQPTEEANGRPQDPPVSSATKPKAKDSAKKSNAKSKSATAPKDAASKGKKSSSKPKAKDGEAPAAKKKRKRKPMDEDDEPLAAMAKKGRKKKAAASSRRKASDGREESKALSDHERSVIDFLGSKGTPKTTEAKKRSDDEAADVIMTFKGLRVKKGEVQRAKKWGQQSQNRVTRYPVVAPEDVPYISSGFRFNLPSLPIEPELTEAEMASTDLTVDPTKCDKGAVEGGLPPIVSEGSGKVHFSGYQRKIFQPKRGGKHDEWWPSNASVRKERRKRGQREDEEDTDEETDAIQAPGISFVKSGVEATKERLATSVEPGVLEKLPHCRLYADFQKQKGGKKDAKPKFCCQTTETFPYETMVCCTICSTWRHAQCGGHHKRYTPDSTDPDSILFEPVCDQCYLEKQFTEKNPVATARLERQRIEHLRRTNATNAVMRQVAFGKHSGQYKWPLGSVSISHISGHTRSVQARHDRAEKQWSDMALRLAGAKEVKPRERQKVRAREFEKLMVSVEDASAGMDRHNMMLFLESDTSKPQPVGFEAPRRNIFDPEEDPVNVPLPEEPAKPAETVENGTTTENGASPKLEASEEETTETTGLNGSMEASLRGIEAVYAAPAAETSSKKEEVCARPGCTRKPRFDSRFCSDPCGVSLLEKDLLHTLQYANRLHPCVLAARL
ncbi:hypothetical protein ACHAXT_011912 [Thalassiosira profunda]